ncbi:Ca2+-binding protein, RTX toxin-related [Roseivivax lentus]|uniref:Ca2+-binding protein, RTX toxin-related n=1 Tax=Roseivivax lentus TaxID=633194 RepID=A0A1N7LY51_9RHOB|nr:Hint domain-containing protein [Roseivivax lentus]SIS78631.1 Ca2+-binding protein, RTX toxin-related [Roseivivax lentus]
MPDLTLDWIGSGFNRVSDGPNQDGAITVETGGVAVDVTYDSISDNSTTYIVDIAGYVAPGEDIDPNSHLKLFAEGNDTGTPSPEATSTVTFDFRSTDPLYGDSVTNVSFRLNDVDAGAQDLAAGPGPGFEDQITIEAIDADGNPAIITITSSGAASVSGSTAIGQVTTNFDDPNGSLLIEIEGPIQSMTLIQDNGGTAQQTVLVSNINFSTTDAEGGNEPPVAVDDFEFTFEDTPVTVDVDANDSDPDGDTLTVTGVTDGANGTAVVDGGGNVVYTPNAGFIGEDTVTYTIDDGNGGTDTADLIITVEPEPDDNAAPDAVDDTATTTVNTPVTIPVLANDSDPDGDPITTVSAIATNGIAAVNADGTVTFTPDVGFTGTAEIGYAIEDPSGASDSATVTITVTDPPNQPPVAADDTALTDNETPVTVDVAANDTDPDGDTLTVTSVSTPANGIAAINGDGDVLYTPNPGFVGEDTITYTIDDGNGGTDTGELIVTVVEPGPSDGRIDADVFPVPAADQPLDPLDGNDEDPDPDDNRDSVNDGGSGNLIATGDDADTISGNGGNDTIFPGIDDDVVGGGGGDDYIEDVQGADTIRGGQGNDTIIAGFDTFSDYENDDPSFPLTIGGTTFDSDPNTEDGRDYVEGNQGNDVISTGDDRDTLDGGQGNDTLDGGIDDDLIMGGQGDDILLGGHGSDTLDGGQDNDLIDGSAPASLEIPDDLDPQTENDRDLLQGFLGNDTLIGGDDDDTLEGGSGEDQLDGGIDDDLLSGGDDNDTLIGGDGNDTLNGDGGLDFIDGGADRDTIVVSSASDASQPDPANPGEFLGDTVQGGNAGDDFDTLDLSGVGEKDVDWRLVNERPDDDGPGNPSNGIDGTIEFLNGAGEVTGSMDFFNIEEIVPCFTPGTKVATPQGERLVEDLREGDKIITRDNGLQEIRWVGRKDLTGFELARKPHMKPILIRAGSLGNNLPEHDMLVSPNHRMLVNNDKTALYFEEREVLAAAKHLTGLEGVDEVRALGVSYIHFMFDRHEVVLANGAWTESFQPGDYSLKGIGNAQRNEILELFPELAETEGLKGYAAARRSLKKHEARLLTR